MMAARCLSASYHLVRRNTLVSRAAGQHPPLRQKQASSSSWTNRLRETSSSLFEQATKAASGQLQRGAKQVVERSSELITSASQRALDTGRNAASSTFAEGSKLAKKTAKATTDAAQSVASSATSSATETGSRVASQVGQSASHTINALGQAASSAAKTVGDAASNSVQSSGRALVDEVKSVASTFYTRLWWWSLAAIFVYGLATTLPGVLVDAWKESRKQGQAAITEDTKEGPQSGFNMIGSIIFGRDDGTEESTESQSGAANSWRSMLPSWIDSRNDGASDTKNNGR